MSTRTRTAALTTILVLSLSALAACGSDDDAGAQDPVGETSSAAPAPSPDESATPSQTPSGSATAAPAETTPAVPTLPACSEVWVAGARMPGSYEGCLEGETTVPADGRYCEFGKPIFSYGRDMYAVAGGPVNVTERPLMRDPSYRQALEACGG